LDDGAEGGARARLVDGLLARRKTVLAVLFAGTVAAALSAARLEFSTSPETLLDTDDPSLHALRAHERDFVSFERRLVLVVRAEDAFAPEVLARVGEATARIAALPETTRVRSLTRSGFPLPAAPGDLREAALSNRLLTPFLVSRDGRTTAILADLDPTADDPDRREESIRSVVAAARAAGLDPEVSGIPAVRQAYADYILESILRLPPILVAVLGVLLVLTVRSVLPVVGLLASIGLAALWTIGILGVAGARITALTSILPALLMVVGIAAGVHVIARYQEERARGARSPEAARTALAKMAFPCALTALTTAVGFSSLLVAGIRDVREFGLFSAVGALLMFVIGVPLMGILLSFLPDSRSRPPAGGYLLFRPLGAVARLLDGRPWVGFAAGAALAGLAAAGIARLEQDTFLLEDIDEDAPLHRATASVDRAMGGVIGFDVVIESEESLLRPETVEWMQRVEERIRRISGVRGVLGPGTLLAEASSAAGDLKAPELLILLARTTGGGDMVRAFLSGDRRRARVMVRTGDVGSRVGVGITRGVRDAVRAGSPESVRVRLGGLSLMADTVLSRLVREMAKSTALAFVVIFALMTLLFRSLRIGLVSMVPNFLPLVAAAGFMGFAGITIRSSMALIFAVALGIAVDDTIHVLTRYRREIRAGRSRREATAASLRSTGRPVVISSAILIAGFLTYLTAGFKATQQFGVIAAVTIAAALVGDLLLLPAMLFAFARRRRSKR